MRSWLSQNKRKESEVLYGDDAHVTCAAGDMPIVTQVPTERDLARPANLSVYPRVVHPG